MMFHGDVCCCSCWVSMIVFMDVGVSVIGFLSCCLLCIFSVSEEMGVDGIIWEIVLPIEVGIFLYCNMKRMMKIQ